MDEHYSSHPKKDRLIKSVENIHKCFNSSHFNNILTVNYGASIISQSHDLERNVTIRVGQKFSSVNFSG